MTAPSAVLAASTAARPPGRLRPFRQLDVFTDTPYRGNPLAVVLDGGDLDDAQLQRFAHWTNLSETTFLLRPTDPLADYRVRIFTPAGELPFAGHPTLGSCHAWLAAGGRPKDRALVQQECGVGLVPVRRDGARLAFRAPPLRRQGALDEGELARIVAGLGVAAGDVLASAWCDNGPGWRGLLLRDAACVLAVVPSVALLQGLKVGIVGAHPAGSACAYEVRAFFPGAQGLTEDPVTGSLNASLAQWLIGAGIAPRRYTAAQGSALGRAGRVFVDATAGPAGEIWIGGHTVECIRGEVVL